MKATVVLRDEHEGILAMLAVIEQAAYRLRDGKSVPPDLMTNAVGFLKNFADRCHHGKEEKQLFPAMEAYGIPNENGPIGMMLIEHVQGRAFIRNMSEPAERLAKGDASQVPALVENALGYVALLKQHIAKENEVLFVMADHALPDTEQTRLHQAFERIEAEEMGAGVHEHYHAMIDEYRQLAAGWK